VPQLAVHRGWKVVGVCVDNDMGASNGKPRPAYQRLLNGLSPGLVEVVIIWDLDRLHRRPAELEQFLELADQRRVSLASVGGDIDLATPSIVTHPERGPPRSRTCPHHADGLSLAYWQNR
jgi:site-specific DNA recombinase